MSRQAKRECKDKAHQSLIVIPDLVIYFSPVIGKSLCGARIPGVKTRVPIRDRDFRAGHSRPAVMSATFLNDTIWKTYSPRRRGESIICGIKDYSLTSEK